MTHNLKKMLNPSVHQSSQGESSCRLPGPGGARHVPPGRPPGYRAAAHASPVASAGRAPTDTP